MFLFDILKSHIVRHPPACSETIGKRKGYGIVFKLCIYLSLGNQLELLYKLLLIDADALVFTSSPSPSCMLTIFNHHITQETLAY